MDLDAAIEQAENRPAAYVLMGATGEYLYKGACRDLKERLKDHRAGRCSKTKNRRPLALVHFEYCDTYSDALKREKWLKSGQGRKWLADDLAGGQRGQTVPPKADPPPAGNLLATPDACPPL